MRIVFTRSIRTGLYRNIRLLFALSVAFLFSSVSNATPPGERIKGTVVDPSGARVADVRVILRDKPGRAAHETRTDSDGRFEFANVADGQYVLAAEAEGFAQVEKVIIDPGSTNDIVVRLAVAAIADHTVITATRTDTPIAELGGSVSVTGQDELKRENQTLVSESLRQTPGLVVTQSGGRGGLTSIFARGGESDYNKVLIDGVAVNQAGGLFDFSALTPENLDRIEVVRGPRSALFGSDAMTSVIQLFTRRGTTSTPELELSGEGGNLDFHREVARLSGLAGWFDYSASFGFQSTDGRFDNNDFTNRSASLNLGFQLAPSAELRLTSRWN
ncbi:MAG TPA: TonB-dependent receptor plug domain-containing protein, partial [Blastocatellia bacterium]|nr:TonB-dependent receptor plug domain-containing protein [Blastocatellia bacterium]